MIATILSFFLLERIGRRAILVYGSFFLSLANVLMIIGLYLKGISNWG